MLTTVVSELPDSARRNPELRRVAMRRQVAEAGYVRVDTLASEYGVSIMTVHRDLDELERLGFLHKVRGGATSAPTTTFHGDLEHRMQAQVDAKLDYAQRSDVLADLERAAAPFENPDGTLTIPARTWVAAATV